LLEGAERERALAIAREIGDAVRADAYAHLGPSLASGQAGLALLFGYLDQALPDSGYGDVSGDYLETAFTALGKLPSPSLYSGALGLGFAIQHLSFLFGEADDDPLEELDSWALSLVERPADDLPEYDLISGWVGVGAYALERLPRPRAEELLERVVERILALAERSEQGLAWRHRVELLPAWQRPSFPQGWYNLGVAHGVPGIVALAGECVRAGVATARCREILQGLLPWMEKQQIPGRGGFPTQVAPGTNSGPARSAWCYGDPGVAIALLGAGGAAGNEEWRGWALDLARKVTKRADHEHGVVDAMLCHGTVGLAHIFNRFFQATREPVFADAARRWFDKTLALRKPGTGVAGFSSYEPGAAGEDPRTWWKANPGILTGAAGVALALVAGASSVAPNWDRMLMCRVPPARWRP
jgi:hypothetical protein